MNKTLRLILIGLLAVLCLSTTAFAADADLYVSSQNIRFSTDQIFEGTPVRIYATVGNRGSTDARGLVRFFLGSTAVQIGSDQPVSVLAGNNDIAFVDLYPPKGQHTIIVKLTPWEPSLDDASNNITSRTIWVKGDHDHDKIADEEDSDDDNDGVLDEDDLFPLDGKESVDSDGDGKGDNADEDDDNDGIPDESDAFPLDPTESEDQDQDGIGDNADPDDDGDNLDDDEEELIGLDSDNPDTDGDGTLDGDDAFPLDPSEAFDTDRDGLGNIMDTNDDGDSVLDEFDPFPLNHGPIVQYQISWFRAANFGIDFDATGSLDPDGRIAKAVWEFNGTTKEGIKTTHVFQDAGKQEIILTVFDNMGEGRRLAISFWILSLPLALFLGFVVIVVTLAFGSGIFYSLRNSKH